MKFHKMKLTVPSILAVMVLGAPQLHAQPQPKSQALAASIPNEEFVALAMPQSQASGITITRSTAANLIKFIDQWMSRPSSFITTSRNPFASNFKGLASTGSITAKEVWESVKGSLPIAGVSINQEDASKSAVILGDVILQVGVPLPDYVLDSPIKVLLVSVSNEEAIFRILMPDPNRIGDENVKLEDFTVKFLRELIPTITPSSRYRVKLPDKSGDNGGGTPGSINPEGAFRRQGLR